ncbi:MAG: C40 family peptidase [Lachnospiraceae bacterium]
MVNFALQFLGNPYVWGGTSLTNGCDCSGFVQSIYAYYGYSLPRVADAQSGYGMQIPISSAQPGDLIFYAKNGYVYHVSMYIGNGQVVHAAGRKLGIITSGISGNAVWATRIITG